MSKWTQRMLAASAVGCLMVASCGASSPAPADETWAEPAVALFDEVAAAYEEDDPYSVARFFTLGGSLDLRAWQRGIVTDPYEMADVLRRRGPLQNWFEPDVMRIEALYLSSDGAVASFLAADWGGYFESFQLYAMGGSGSIDSRMYVGEFGRNPWQDWVRPHHHDLLDRYRAAWTTGDATELADIYAPDAVIRNGLSEQRWDDIDQLLDDLGGRQRLDPGPWPQLFFYGAGSHQEVIAFVQLAGECPRPEARRWVLDGLRIVEETRFAHLPSVRRCGLPASDGWWDDFEVAPETDRFNDRIIEIAGREIQLVNADDVHVQFVEWSMGRYSAAGIGYPDVAAIWFAPALSCPLPGSVARRHDERFDDQHSVTLCFDRAGLTVGGTADGSRWAPTSTRLSLHELAHVWMYDHLDDETRAAFVERAGLEVWRGDRMWGELGVEHAAETIAWGVAGADAARYEVSPVPSCEELTARFELLTGTPPATECTEWSPT